jgi:hypothetical protein
MAQQLRNIILHAERPHVMVHVIPIKVAAHPGLLGGFAMLDFAAEPTVVFIEGRQSGMFPENPAEIQEYRLAAELMMDVALSEQESLLLLRSIANDLEGAR